METERITLPPLAADGEVTTVYAYDSGALRSTVLASMARELAGRAGAATPVLMIDWDTAAPSLHGHFDVDPGRPGLLEWAAGLLLRLGEAGAAEGADPASRAGMVLEALDWHGHVQRADDGRPLYLMTAGVQDSAFGERAAAFDWQALFYACPALFQAMMVQLRRHFAHVLVNAPTGRSAAASICTALLPRKLVALFMPSRPSLDGACGMVARAVETRCASALEERPLMVYPVGICGEGDQQRWEGVLADCYGLARISLDAWFADMGRMFAWIEPGHPPWLSLEELALREAVAEGRMAAVRGGATASLPHELLLLGDLCLADGRIDEARDCYQESLELRQRALGDEHPDTGASRRCLAEALRAGGRLAEARFLYELLAEDAERQHGAGSRPALSARAGLAAILARLDPEGEGCDAIAAVATDCESALGAGDRLTLDCLLLQANVLARCGEPGRARILVERVLDLRWRQLGSEHPATLAALEQLALLLLQGEDQSGAVRLQQQVVEGHAHQYGDDHPLTVAARERLGRILTGEALAAPDIGAAPEMASPGVDHPVDRPAPPIMRVHPLPSPSGAWIAPG